MKTFKYYQLTDKAQLTARLDYFEIHGDLNMYVIECLNQYESNGELVVEAI